jgi:hypothetical protein
MSRGRFVYDAKTGTFKEGKASPRLLPENLRELPGDKVTQDEDDETKAHELDPDHIVDAIKSDLAHQELTERAPRALADPEKAKAAAIKEKLNEILEFVPPGYSRPLNQKRIDGVRFRILNQLVNRAYEVFRKGGKTFPTLYHVWFPKDDIACYELRAGTPPNRNALPSRLKRFDLVIDLEAWPQRIIDALEYAGFAMPKRVDVKTEIERLERDNASIEGNPDDVATSGNLPGLPGPGGEPAKCFV